VHTLHAATLTPATAALDANSSSNVKRRIASEAAAMRVSIQATTFCSRAASSPATSAVTTSATAPPSPRMGSESWAGISYLM
jgi:hypothetical protein